MLPHAEQQAARLSCSALAVALGPFISRISVNMVKTAPAASGRSGRLRGVSRLHAQVADSGHWEKLQALTAQLPALSDLAVDVGRGPAGWPGMDGRFFSALAGLTAVTRLHLDVRGRCGSRAAQLPKGLQLPAVRVAAFKTVRCLELRVQLRFVAVLLFMHHGASAYAAVAPCRGSGVCPGCATPTAQRRADFNWVWEVCCDCDGADMAMCSGCSLPWRHAEVLVHLPF
jgi:hypothetical protein